jgi:hypothetical protein
VLVGDTATVALGVGVGEASGVGVCVSHSTRCGNGTRPGDAVAVGLEVGVTVAVAVASGVAVEVASAGSCAVLLCGSPVGLALGAGVAVGWRLGVRVAVGVSAASGSTNFADASAANENDLSIDCPVTLSTIAFGAGTGPTTDSTEFRSNSTLRSGTLSPSASPTLLLPVTSSASGRHCAGPTQPSLTVSTSI